MKIAKAYPKQNSLEKLLLDMALKMAKAIINVLVLQLENQ